MAFAAALQGFQQVPASQDDWIQFIKAIGNAYDTDLAEVKTSMKDSKPLRSLLFDTHHKPIKYTDDRDSKLEVTFKQWIADVRSMIRRYSKKHAQMLDIAADRNIWNQSDFGDELTDEKFTEEEIEAANEEVFEILKTVTSGDARRIVDAHEDKGLEAWWRLQNRFRPKGLRGATDIAKRIQSIKRPGNSTNTYSMLQQLENDVRDFAKASAGEPMPSAMIRHAMLQCVPDGVERAVRLQVDIDKIEVQLLRDRLEQHARTDMGPKPMEVGNVDKGKGFIEPEPQVSTRQWSDEEAAREEQERNSGLCAVTNDLWFDKYGNALIPPEKLELFGLKGKGKGGGKNQGKGRFTGCAICGQEGHWKNECPQAGKGNKGQWKGGGKWGGKNKGGYQNKGSGKNGWGKSGKGKGGGGAAYGQAAFGLWDDDSTWWDKQYQNGGGVDAMGVFMSEDGPTTPTTTMCSPSCCPTTTPTTTLSGPRQAPAIGKKGIKLMQIHVCDLPEETPTTDAEFKVPVKRVKTINRPKIIKKADQKNRFDQIREDADIIQETNNGDAVETKENSTFNSLQVDCVHDASVDMSNSVLKSTQIPSNYARKHAKYARRRIRRVNNMLLDQADAEVFSGYIAENAEKISGCNSSDSDEDYGSIGKVQDDFMDDSDSGDSGDGRQR